MLSVWNPVNGMLAHSQTGVAPSVQYVNPAISDPVRNCPASVVVNRFTIHVCPSPVLARDCIVLIDPTFVRVVSSARAVVVKASTFT